MTFVIIISCSSRQSTTVHSWFAVENPSYWQLYKGSVEGKRGSTAVGRADDAHSDAAEARAAQTLSVGIYPPFLLMFAVGAAAATIWAPFQSLDTQDRGSGTEATQKRNARTEPAGHGHLTWSAVLSLCSGSPGGSRALSSTSSSFP